MIDDIELRYNLCFCESLSKNIGVKTAILVMIITYVGINSVFAQDKTIKTDLLTFSSSIQFDNCIYFRTDNYLEEEKSKKLFIPAIYSLSLQVINISLLVVTNNADNQPSWSVFKEAFSKPPVFDDDKWPTNYVAHPLMGSETYLRARDSEVGVFGSFLFSTAASLTWEYLIESWTERPSIQDMILTSTVGCVIGELRYFGKKRINQKYKWMLDPIWVLTCVIVGSTNK